MQDCIFNNKGTAINKGPELSLTTEINWTKANFCKRFRCPGALLLNELPNKLKVEESVSHAHSN